MNNITKLVDIDKNWDNSWVGCTVKMVGVHGVKYFKVTENTSTSLMTRELTKLENATRITTNIVFYPYKLINKLVRKISRLYWKIRIFIEDRIIEFMGLEDEEEKL